MKLFNNEQIRQWDNYTIANEPITSLALMERASATFVNWFIGQFSDKERPIYIFCGRGNNGGDGLAIARLLHEKSYHINLFVFPNSGKESVDYTSNLQRINEVNLSIIEHQRDFPKIPENAIIIDALFGTGLKRALTDLPEALVAYLNQLDATSVSVDLPSGLMSDSVSSGTIFKANHTFSFEQPKLAFLFPENADFVGHWMAHSIGLSKAYYKSVHTDNNFLTDQDIKSLLKKRPKFGHKGNFGHALMIVGSKGMIGAAILSTSAALRSGSGLTTIYAPSSGYEILQSTIPEAMVLNDPHNDYLTHLPKNISNFNAIGIGCGIGTNQHTQKVVGDLLKNHSQPLVLDADALNIIALNPEMINDIPKKSILTPHPKEFERLFGKTKDQFERYELQKQKAIELQCYILVKGAHSCAATPKGQCFFNSTGNPGMATAGSGDVLTGIIVGLLAQNYSPKASICIGIYLHGLAGDLAAYKLGEASLMARDLIKYLPNAFIKLVPPTLKNNLL